MERGTGLPRVDDVDVDPEPPIEVGRPRLEPITERILRVLPGHRWLWIVLWSSIPLLSPLVFSTAVRATGRPFTTAEFAFGVSTQAGIAWACFVMLWGCGHLAAEASTTRDELLDAAADQVPHRLFERISRAAGPAVLTAVIAGIIATSNWIEYGPVPPLASLTLLVAYMLPIMTFIWVYVAILADIDRLGELPVVLDRFPQDRTMGLGRVGSLASSGLGLLFLAAIPVILVGSVDPVALALSLTLVLGVVGIYALSMWRLHRQMAAAKRRHVEHARRIYGAAYAPLRDRTDLEALAAASSALSVAQSLDERAAELPTWPIDEGTGRFVAVIITGVVTSLVVRALFLAVGL
jgi:hypothetical protein